MCANCGHTPHPNRGCLYSTVTGPPSNDGRRVGDSYEHVGRTVTPCPCSNYYPELNGKDTL